MTDPAAASGTDRVAEVARQMPDVDVVVNVQGDEPEIAGDAIDLAVQLLEDAPDAVMSTLATPIRSREKLDDPACVKVVFDDQRRALYFSRSPIPHAREWDDGLLAEDPPHFHQHIGLYAYRREFLLRLAQLPQLGRGEAGKPGTTACSGGWIYHSGRRHRRAHDRHRHRERLSGICQTRRVARSGLQGQSASPFGPSTARRMLRRRKPCISFTTFERTAMTKHIFVTGGVVSSLGKGLTSASVGMLLERRGLRVKMQKLDPYINVDPGTMSPYQHGEVYVLDDGSETDLDLGHYERFTHSPLTRDSNYTTGQIYLSVIEKERRGEFLGKTVQVIPHITNEIKGVIQKLADDETDVVITEIGGTVGDIESQPFLEAIRQFSLDIGKENCLYIHLTLVPYLKAAGELKTKPTQHSVGQLRQIGIQPDVLICRTERPVSLDDRKKIALFCNVPMEAVIEEQDKEFSIYEVPLSLVDHGWTSSSSSGCTCPPARWTWTTGATCCTACATRSTRSASRSSASTPNTTTPTSRSTSRWTTRGFTTTPRCGSARSAARTSNGRVPSGC